MRTSEAVAFPRFTIKFACLGDTIASPTRSPLHPAASISRPAYSPSGRLNTLPAEGTSNGCRALRFRMISFRRSVRRAASVFVNPKAASMSIRSSSPLARRYPKSTSDFAHRCLVPSGAIPSIQRSRSEISAPKAPAFIRSAPPTVPGIPDRLSNPPNPCSSQHAVKRFIRTADPAITCSPSTRNAPQALLRFTTTPRNPASLTRRFVPFPMTNAGISRSPQTLRSAVRSSTSAGTTYRSAGPPIR